MSPGQSMTFRAAHAYLVTDEMVAETSARHSRVPRRLDEISRNAVLSAPASPAPKFRPEYESTEDAPAAAAGEMHPAPEEIRWTVLSAAPPEGASIADLAFACRRTRRWVYYRLQEHAQAGRVVQVQRGYWRAARPAGDGQSSRTRT